MNGHHFIHYLRTIAAAEAAESRKLDVLLAARDEAADSKPRLDGLLSARDAATPGMMAELGRRIAAEARQQYAPVEAAERRTVLSLIAAENEKVRRARIGFERRIIGPAASRPCDVAKEILSRKESTRCH